MPFREKSAWISFLITLGVYAYYFWHVAAMAGATDAAVSRLLVKCVVGLVILQSIFHSVIARQAPGDARAPMDERERLIALKATNIAFTIAAGGGVIVAASLLYGAPVRLMANLLLLALVVAELSRYVSQIVYFRRDV